MSISGILKINQEYNKRIKKLFAGNNARDLSHFTANYNRNLEDNNVMDLFYLLQDGLNLFEPVIPQGCAAVIQNGANPAALTVERQKALADYKKAKLKLTQNENLVLSSITRCMTEL
jgi:hypothetical protein